MTDIPALPPKVAEAVVKVMGDVGYVQKKGVNSFHNYKFAAVGDVLAKIQPAMHEAGLLIAQDEVGHEVLADAAMTATYQFVLSHASGETWQHFPRHTGMAAPRTQKGSIDDKALNKCHTAARKYFLLALFQIPTGEAVDPDMDGDVPDKAGAKIVRPTLAPSPVDKQNAAQSRADVVPEDVLSAGGPPASFPDDVPSDPASVKKWFVGAIEAAKGNNKLLADLRDKVVSDPDLFPPDKDELRKLIQEAKARKAA